MERVAKEVGVRLRLKDLRAFWSNVAIQHVGLDGVLVNALQGRSSGSVLQRHYFKADGDRLVTAADTVWDWLKSQR